MLTEIIKQLKTGFILILLITLLTGIIYPFVITGLAHYFFPWQANGSLIAVNNRLVGSLLIGQSFTEPNYFWGRPSATTPFPYNAENSSGSNLGPSNPDLLAAVKTRISALQPGEQSIPVDLVTASGSGLDPEISPLAAFYQVPRIAKARKISEQALRLLIQQFIKTPTFGILGEARVNVLQLNLALDNLKTEKSS
jgi:K+-transporting ATPase ATPase C chain